MEVSKQRNGQFTTRFIFSLPLEKRFKYNGGKQTEKWAVRNEVYILYSIGETLYTIYNGDKRYTNRGFYSVFQMGSKRFIYNGDKQTEKWAVHKKGFIYNGGLLGKRFIYNGDKQTEKWAVHKKVYIQSSIGETYI